MNCVKRIKKMQNYKATDNSLHAIEPEFAHLLPSGCVPITEAEAEALRPKPDPKLSIQAQIDALEREVILPRVTREFMLAQMEAVAASQGVTPEQLRAINYGYRRVKEFDEQIEALRGQL
jgi:hypothetical protein